MAACLAVPAAAGEARAPAAGKAGVRAAAAGGTPARVSFGGVGVRIPKGFFGLSVEYSELQTYERSGVLFDRVIAMLRPQPDGAMTLRIGGKSADHTLWEPNPRTAPNPKSVPRTLQIGNAWLADLAAFVRSERLHVILDLNLAVHSPSMAAAFAAAARKALPPGALSALEIGNEPDMYHYQPRLTHERVASTLRSTSRDWWKDYSSSDYRRDYLTYARALRKSVPGIPLGAPDITQPDKAWLTSLADLGRLRPNFLAIHRYGTSLCWGPNSPGYPTIAHLLNENATAGLAASVAPWVRYAHARGMGLRLTEVNSVSCQGNRGVANSFATALWAPDALFSMIKAGVNAISFHIRPWPVNAPFHFTKSGIQAEPELYGLAVFALMTQGTTNLLHSTVTAHGRLHLKAWAVRRGSTVNVLLINKGPEAASVSLRGLQHPRTAEVRRLTAPSARATGGVRFAGQRIGSDALWQGAPVIGQLRPRGRYYHLRVAPYSAVLVTL